MTRPLLLVCTALALVSCAAQKSHITDISDLPIKQTTLPRTTWELSPLRAYSMYVLYDAKSMKDRRNFIGDYYYVNWYDAEPDKPVKLVMHYTQAKTTRSVNMLSKEITEPRSSAGMRKERFFFNGPERLDKGDILSWRIELYVDGELRDSRQSYLWE